MANINTKVILANDDLGNWNQSSRKLKKGEVALAKNSNGTYELRVGQDGNWSAAAKLQLSSNQIVGLDQDIKALSTSYHVKSTKEELDALSSVAHNGDTGVVSSLIADGKYSCTAYVFDSTISAWKAMDGNYTADNVYFDSGFDLYGDYTQVGNIKRSAGTYDATGKSLKEVLGDILDTTIQAGLSDAPTTTVKLNEAGTYEIGTKITPTWKVTYTQGKYVQSWNNNAKISDGTTVTQLSVYDSDELSTVTTSGSTGSFNEITATTTAYKVSAKSAYSAGSVANNNKGTTGTTQRAAGETDASDSSTIIGVRYMFAASTATIIDTTSATIASELRTLFDTAGSTKQKNEKCTANPEDGKGTFNVTIKDGSKQVIIAVLKSNSIVAVLDKGAFGTDIFAKFAEPIEVDIPGASNYTAATYKVYVLTPKAALGSNTYGITVA